MSNKRPETKLVPVPSVNKIPERDVDKIKALWKDGWDQGRSLHGPQGGGKIGRDGAVPRKLEKTCYGNQQESRSGQEGSRPVARKAQFPLLYGNVADIVHPQAGFHRIGKCVG